MNNSIIRKEILGIISQEELQKHDFKFLIFLVLIVELQLVHGYATGKFAIINIKRYFYSNLAPLDHYKSKKQTNRYDTNISRFENLENTKTYLHEKQEISFLIFSSLIIKSSGKNPMLLSLQNLQGSYSHELSFGAVSAFHNNKNINNLEYQNLINK